MKYSPTMIKACEAWIMEHGLMDYGGAKLKDFMQAMGIHHKSYYLWLQKDEFRNAVERAKQYFKEHLCRDLVISLAEAAKGGERESVVEHVEYRQNPDDPSRPIIYRKTTNKTKTFVSPNVAAGIFLLCNLDPEHYRNSQRSDITLKKTDDADDSMTIEEVNAEIERLEKLQK